MDDAAPNTTRGWIVQVPTSSSPPLLLVVVIQYRVDESYPEAATVHVIDVLEMGFLQSRYAATADAMDVETGTRIPNPTSDEYTLMRASPPLPI